MSRRSDHLYKEFCSLAQREGNNVVSDRALELAGLRRSLDEVCTEIAQTSRQLVSLLGPPGREVPSVEVQVTAGDSSVEVLNCDEVRNPDCIGSDSTVNSGSTVSTGQKRAAARDIDGAGSCAKVSRAGSGNTGNAHRAFSGGSVGSDVSEFNWLNESVADSESLCGVSDRMDVERIASI